jgi:hypothetical protein
MCCGPSKVYALNFEFEALNFQERPSAKDSHFAKLPFLTQSQVQELFILLLLVL